MSARSAEEARRLSGLVERVEEVVPPAPFRLPVLTGADRMTRRRGATLARLLHLDEVPVLVLVAQRQPKRVVFRAVSPSERAAEHGIARMRFALGVDDEIVPFLRAYAEDPLIGSSVRRRPWLRVRRRPEPFEALAFAISEQLIEYHRAAAIQRRLLAALGRRWSAASAARGLLDLPPAAVLAGTAPALLESFDLAGTRALTLVRVAREVARGAVNLHDALPERGWRRLRGIPGVGRWTIENLALHGQGRFEHLPAGDLHYLKLVGRLASGGDPRARAEEDEVRAFFAPYGEWAGLAAVHMPTS